VSHFDTVIISIPKAYPLEGVKIKIFLNAESSRTDSSLRSFLDSIAKIRKKNGKNEKETLTPHYRMCYM